MHICACAHDRANVSKFSLCKKLQEKKFCQRHALVNLAKIFSWWKFPHIWYHVSSKSRHGKILSTVARFQVNTYGICMSFLPKHNCYTTSFLLTDTTGLQSSVAIVELNGSITVTCTFANGASSTGCQVKLFMMDNLQEALSMNLFRPERATQVCKFYIFCTQMGYNP